MLNLCYCNGMVLMTNRLYESQPRATNLTKVKIIYIICWLPVPYIKICMGIWVVPKARWRTSEPQRPSEPQFCNGHPPLICNPATRTAGGTYLLKHVWPLQFSAHSARREWAINKMELTLRIIPSSECTSSDKSGPGIPSAGIPVL